MIKELCITSLLMLFTICVAFAQTTIEGTVTNATDGTPLIGVTVKVKNTGQGTITDANGTYKISLPTNHAILVFSYLGYATKEIKIDGQQELNVSLNPNKKELSQIVVIGYGTQRKEDLTTAVSSIKGEEITERPTTNNLVQGLAGKAPGVNVMVNSGKPGGSPIIRIRGMGSLNASNTPLYVVDGIVGVDPNSINVNIIKSVDILKGAAAASIYGSRGANGVVVITTQDGNRNASNITFKNMISFGFLQKELPLLDATGALEMLKKEYAYVPGRLPPHLAPNNNFPRKADLFNPDGTPKYNTDWQKAATRTAISHNHSLTFSGGKEDLTVLANISFRKDEGLMLKSYAKRLDGFVKIGWDVKPWLHIQASIMAGGRKGNNNAEAGGYPLSQTAIRRMYSTMPFLPVKYPDGAYSRNGDYPGEGDAENPVRLLKEIQNETGNTYEIGNMKGTFHLSDHLDLISTFSGQSNTSWINYYAGTGLRGISETQNGVAQRTNIESGSWTNEDYFSYKNTFGKHLLNATAGASWYYNVSTSTFAGSENFFDNSFTFNSLQAGSVTEIPTSGLDENQFNSFYGRLHYAYNDRYLLDVSYRMDGSSRFGSNNKYGTFPSFSAAWIISNEPFFKGIAKTVDFFKLRAGYGFVGNAEIGNYVTRARLSNSQTVFNHTRVSDVTLSSLANPNLTWEKSKQFDIGINAGFFNGRIQLTADVYNKITKDLLYTKALPATSGYASAIDNIGSIRNRGVEIALNTVNISSPNFTWSTTLNYSMNRNRVLNINGDIIYPWQQRIKEGHPLNEFYNYVRLGVWSTKEADEAAKYGQKPGDLKYADLNNDGTINADDRKDLGNAMPDFETNMTNTLSYKNISLHIDLESMVGLKIYNNTLQFLTGQSNNVNGLKHILNSWTPDHQNTMLSQLRITSDPNGGVTDADSYFVKDATFLRVRNVALTYKLNAAWLKRIAINYVSFGVAVENVLLLTKYDGYDPEINSFNSYDTQGVDLYQYPKPRTIALSMNVNF